MRLFKLSDLIIQGFLFVGGFIFLLSNTSDNPRFLYPYYALGSWQLLSFALHALHTKNLFFRKQRRAYGKTILWLLLIGIVSYLSIFVEAPLILFFLLALLIISPFLGIWYFTICLRELQFLNKKLLVHLK